MLYDKHLTNETVFPLNTIISVSNICNQIHVIMQLLLPILKASLRHYRKTEGTDMINQVLIMIKLNRKGILMLPRNLSF